jgi:hypothetical protein
VGPQPYGGSSSTSQSILTIIVTSKDCTFNEHQQHSKVHEPVGTRTAEMLLVSLIDWTRLIAM